MIIYEERNYIWCSKEAAVHQTVKSVKMVNKHNFTRHSMFDSHNTFCKSSIWVISKCASTNIFDVVMIIINVFLARLSMPNMLKCAEQVQIQNYKTHAYKTPKIACVQTITLKHPTKHER